MEERDQILIDLYLAGELQEAQRLELEKRKQDDPVFRKEFLEYEITSQALRASQRKELEQRIKKLDNELDNTNPNQNGFLKKQMPWILLGLTVLILYFVWKSFLAPSTLSGSTQSDSQDTTQVNKSPVLTDSTILQDNKSNDQPPKDTENKNQQPPAMADDSQKRSELFAEYFDPLKDDAMDPSIRGEQDNESSTLSEFRKSYWKDNYAKAVSLFPMLSPGEQKNENLRFIYALSLAAIKKSVMSQDILESIISKKTSLYIEEARWYLGLVYLENGDIPNAKKYLQQCLDDPNGFNKKQAKELLKKIE